MAVWRRRAIARTQGAAVTVTDLADEQALAESVAQLADVPIARFAFGRHHQGDFQSAEVVVVNPAVRPENSFVAAARQSGAEITSETELFLNACPAVVVGVTGTVGKSTTATMLAEMIAAAGRRSWLGGNIGHSLLADLPRIRSDDIVVLEMSSFQLHWLSETAQLAAARNRDQLLAQSFGLARKLGTLCGGQTALNFAFAHCGNRGFECGRSRGEAMADRMPRQSN